MNSINNPLDLLELKPLKYLDEHLEALWMQVASGECQYDRDWDAIDARGLSAFKDVIISFQDSGSRHDCYQYLLSTLFSAYNKFDSLERPLDGHHKEINWCEEAKRLIIRYLARVVKYTLYDGPDNCAYHMAKEVQQIPHTRGREQFLLDIGDALGIRDTICKYKVEQCRKCSIIPCEGRYIDGLCGLPEPAFGANIYKPVYKEIPPTVPFLRKSPSIVINNVFNNKITQNNYSLVQQNFSHTDVFQIEETEREKELNKMNSRQRESFNKSLKKMLDVGYCTQEGFFCDEALTKALTNYGDSAKRRGQLVLGLLKGLFADAIRTEAGIGHSWVEVSALLHYSGIGGKYNEAVKYKKSSDEQEKGVYRCLLEIVQGVFPKYSG